MSAYASRWRRAHVVLLAVVLLALLLIGSAIFDDVIAQPSGAFDTTVLWFIRRNIPAAWSGFFSAVTATGSGTFLVTVTVLLTALLLRLRYRREALLLALSLPSAGLLTYAIKALVNRARPDLWGAAWYSSSSFPSGHTLCTTAVATALVLCAARVGPRPASSNAAAALAVVWAGLVGLSRLVLGAHWPTDVLAAAVVGVFIPLAICTLLDGFRERQLAR